MADVRQPQTPQEETMEEENVEEKLQLFVVSNEIIYCCLLCSVVVVIASLPLAAAEHVAEASPQISETEIERGGWGQGMLYNCMRIEATIYICISRMASQRIESFNTMKSRIALSLSLSWKRIAIELTIWICVDRDQVGRWGG